MYDATISTRRPAFLSLTVAFSETSKWDRKTHNVITPHPVCYQEKEKEENNEERWRSQRSQTQTITRAGVTNPWCERPRQTLSRLSHNANLNSTQTFLLVPGPCDNSSSLKRGSHEPARARCFLFCLFSDLARALHHGRRYRKLQARSLAL